MIEFTISLRTFAVPRVWKIPMEKRIAGIHHFAEHPTKGVLPPVLFVFFPKEKGKNFFRGRGTRMRNTPNHPRRFCFRQRKKPPRSHPKAYRALNLSFFLIYITADQKTDHHSLRPAPRPKIFCENFSFPPTTWQIVSTVVKKETNLRRKGGDLMIRYYIGILMNTYGLNICDIIAMMMLIR